MSQIKKIMAALCLAEQSPGVYNCAVQLAEQFDAQLVVANVVNIRNVESISNVESMGYEINTQDYVRDVKEDRREQMEKIIETCDFPKNRIKKVISIGHPFEKLMELIREENIDMVVMGAKGRSNLSYMLVGSIAEKIFRHSPVTVVSYRYRQEED